MEDARDNGGIAATSAPRCALCGAAGRVIHRDLSDRTHGVGGVWSHRRCPRCGLAWLDPRPVERHIAKLYPSYYTHQQTGRPSEPLIRFQDTLARHVLPCAFGYPPPTSPSLLSKMLACLPPVRDVAGGSVLWLRWVPQGLVLDVGCGDGRLIERMGRLGWRGVGVEPDPEAARQARSARSVEVIEGTLSQAAPRLGLQDAVTLNHVLEHVVDPFDLLRRCRDLLKPDGRLVVVTPNLESLLGRIFARDWRDLDVPRHLHLFSRRSLREAARRAGLRVLEVRSTARACLWVAWVSLLLRRRVVLPGAMPGPGDSVPWARGLALHAFEEILNGMFRTVGEELVLIAAQDTDRGRDGGAGRAILIRSRGEP